MAGLVEVCNVLFHAVPECPYGDLAIISYLLRADPRDWTCDDPIWMRTGVTRCEKLRMACEIARVGRLTNRLLGPKIECAALDMMTTYIRVPSQGLLVHDIRLMRSIEESYGKKVKYLYKAAEADYRRCKIEELSSESESN